METGPNIYDSIPLNLGKLFHCCNMSPCEVHHVNVISYRCAIFGIEIVAKNGELLQFPESDLERRMQSRVNAGTLPSEKAFNIVVKHWMFRTFAIYGIKFFGRSLGSSPMLPDG